MCCWSSSHLADGLAGFGKTYQLTIGFSAKTIFPEGAHVVTQETVTDAAGRLPELRLGVVKAGRAEGYKSSKPLVLLKHRWDHTHGKKVEVEEGLGSLRRLGSKEVLA